MLNYLSSREFVIAIAFIMFIFSPWIWYWIKKCPHGVFKGEGCKACAEEERNRKIEVENMQEKEMPDKNLKEEEVQQPEQKSAIFPSLKKQLISACIVFLIIFSFFWWFRYQPLGGGSIAYVYDRLTGNIYYLAGVEIGKVKKEK